MLRPIFALVALVDLWTAAAIYVPGKHPHTGLRRGEEDVRSVDARQFFQNVGPPPTEPGNVEGCKLAVIGAGFGGVYFAYRLVFDAKRLSPSEVCVFEAHADRVGGKVLTVRNLLGDPNLIVDVGAYRFAEHHKILVGLVHGRLGLSTRCYLPVTCDDGRRVVVDEGGLNTLGYATPIERMLDELEKGGARIFYGYRLTGLFKDTQTSKSVRLDFSNGGSAVADQVMLGIPSEAISSLDADSLIFTDQTKQAQGGYMMPLSTVSTKIYLEYPDAWWITKLGKPQGFFEDEREPKIYGEYHDGPVRCFDEEGQIAVTSESKAKQCNGLLFVAYTWAYTMNQSRFYRRFQRSDDPLTIIAWNDTDPGFELIQTLHKKVVDMHSEDLKKKGYNVREITPPSHLYMANWRMDNDVTGSAHAWPLFLSGTTVAKTTRALMRPVPGYDVFMANEAFGVVPGWAESSVMMAERVLAYESGIEKPLWLNDDGYYESKVLNLTHFDTEWYPHPRDAQSSVTGK